MTEFLVFIDILNDQRVSGWCLNGADAGTPARLMFYGDHHKIGEIVAGNFREDLKALNFHPTGHCGFDFSIPDTNILEDSACLYVYARGSDEPVWQCRTDEIPRIITGKLPTVFFMHIPKTAGTSFNTFACSRFSANSTATHIENMDEDNYPALQREKSYLAGHLPLRLIKQRFDVSRFDLLTMLREPYRQLHSHVDWIKNIGADPESDFFLSHHRFFRALALKLNEPGFSIVDELESLARHQPKDLVSLFDNNQTRYFLDNIPQKVTASDFYAAKRNLDYFKLTGVTEQYAEFAASFCNSYASNYVEQKHRFNQSEREQLFDCRDNYVRSKLLPLVEFDLMLYEHVVENRLWEVSRPGRS
ncbi:hypothetical protein ACFL1S_03760 [Pseudomonadota bacterium]